jgi:hypothetical protein
MTTLVRIRARLIPWDDADFVRAFDRARNEIERTGCCSEGPAAAEQVQRLLRERGYPKARVEVERSVEEALVHVSHWSVSRDG